MNIIKLKDVIAPESLPWAEYFNTHLKGKYAYWVQMRYIVSFDHMRHEGYVACEEDITKLLPTNGVYPKPFGAPCLDIYDLTLQPYIDVVETDRINSIKDLRIKNEYVADADITIDELKNFRTWLATELLSMDQFEVPIGNSSTPKQKYSLFNSSETHTLEYYANDMYDDTVSILTEFTKPTNDIASSIGMNACGCHSSSDISSLYNTNLSSCDPVGLYKQGIYNKMVQMFSDVNFWTRFSPEFIDTFRRYVVNIIQVNLPLSSTKQEAYLDCTRSSKDDSKSTDILKRLAQSLEYIKNQTVNGHKNYIADALRDWSMYLYESMKW